MKENVQNKIKIKVSIVSHYFMPRMDEWWILENVFCGFTYYGFV